MMLNQVFPLAHARSLQCGDMCRHQLTDDRGLLPVKSPFAVLASFPCQQSAVTCQGHGDAPHRPLKDLAHRCKSTPVTRKFARAFLADLHRQNLKMQRHAGKDVSERNDEAMRIVSGDDAD